jgi:LemA protein
MFSTNWFIMVACGLAVVAAINFMQARAAILANKDRLDRAWREIENMLLDRRNRIPALIKTLENHAASRNQAIDWVRSFGSAVRQAATRADVGVNDPLERAKREDELSKRLRALVELAGTYPDVIGNPEYRESLERLQSTTDRIAEAEKFYNDQVRDYNECITSFPNRVIAGIMKLRPAAPFRLKAIRGDGESESESAAMHQFFARR